jgi:glycosyltransferase involved in cell wall biosynthesis
MKISCSVPVLTLNAKEHLKQCLPLLLENFEDVFIIDGNSTDGTQEYARSLGVRVEKQFETDEPNQRIQDFRTTRLKTWEMCRYDWLLVFDADEILTPELLNVIRQVVAQNNQRQVHQVRRYPKIADGRVITNTPFYSGYYVRLFTRSSGVTLANRKVHERFVIPEGLETVNHEEAIICPEPEAQKLRRRSRHYIQLEVESLAARDWHYLTRWIIWYNARSFFGQLFRVLKAEIKNRLASQPTLPWSYNLVFLEYRWLFVFHCTRAWYKNRRAKRGS